MAVKIGGADGGKYTKKKDFKIKDGDNVYRILPSLGFAGKEPNGRAFKFWNVHFGYKNSEGKMRVFQSPLVKNKEKMVTSPDAALERIEKLKNALEKAKESGDKTMYDRLFPLVGGQKPIYNMDNNHHCNAINENGEIGVLKLRHRAKLALDAVIESLKKKGIQPLSPDQGRFFIINRQGTALETTFTVTVKTKSLTIDGVGEVQQDIVHVLTPDIINRLEAEAADLDNLYKRPTSEEVARIVAESDLQTGRSRAVDEILEKKNSEIEEGPEDEAEQPLAASTTTAQTTPTVIAAAVTQPTVNQTVTPLASQATVQTQSLSQPTTLKIETPAPIKAQATVSGPLSDEDFLKSLA